eukprot:47394-Amphidinium_carterae.2
MAVLTDEALAFQPVAWEGPIFHTKRRYVESSEIAKGMRETGLLMDISAHKCSDSQGLLHSFQAELCDANGGVVRPPRPLSGGGGQGSQGWACRAVREYAVCPVTTSTLRSLPRSTVDRTAPRLLDKAQKGASCGGMHLIKGFSSMLPARRPQHACKATFSLGHELDHMYASGL